MRPFVLAVYFVIALAQLCLAQTPAQPGQPHRIVVSVLDGSIRIQWEVGGGLQWNTFRLDFSHTPTGPPIARVVSGSATDVAFSIPAGTQGSFWLVITGLGPGTEGVPSSPVPFTILSTGCSGPPAAPTDLRVTLTNRVATFNWRPSAGASDYVLQAGRASGGSELFNGSVGAMTGLSAAVPAGLTAFVRVFAQNPCGRSGSSNEVVLREDTGTPLQRWVGQTAQAQAISFEIDSAGVRSVQIRATTETGRSTGQGGNPAACIGEQVMFSWPYAPSAPIVNGQVTLSGVNPDNTIRFELTGSFGATFASGTLAVTIRKPSAFCEGSVSTTWTAVRQQ